MTYLNGILSNSWHVRRVGRYNTNFQLSFRNSYTENELQLLIIEYYELWTTDTTKFSLEM